MPSLDLEQEQWTQGRRHVAGVDEAGRGGLAGPVVAAAVILPPDVSLPGVDDSKKLTPARREVLVATIQETALAVGVGLCSPAEIDDLNILWAAMEAMRRAVEKLHPDPDYLLIDGNRCFRDSPWPYATIVKGDSRSLSIAAASIVAKTVRDQYMRDLDTVHPEYAWAKNKGYPTKDHYEALAAHGPTVFHRHSFTLSR